MKHHRSKRYEDIWLYHFKLFFVAWTRYAYRRAVTDSLEIFTTLLLTLSQEYPEIEAKAALLAEKKGLHPSFLPIVLPFLLEYYASLPALGLWHTICQSPEKVSRDQQSRAIQTLARRVTQEEDLSIYLVDLPTDYLPQNEMGDHLHEAINWNFFTQPLSETLDFAVEVLPGYASRNLMESFNALWHSSSPSPPFLDFIAHISRRDGIEKMPHEHRGDAFQQMENKLRLLLLRLENVPSPVRLKILTRLAEAPLIWVSQKQAIDHYLCECDPTLPKAYETLETLDKIRYLLGAFRRRTFERTISELGLSFEQRVVAYAHFGTDLGFPPVAGLSPATCADPRFLQRFLALFNPHRLVQAILHPPAGEESPFEAATIYQELRKWGGSRPCHF